MAQQAQRPYLPRPTEPYLQEKTHEDTYNAPICHFDTTRTLAEKCAARPAQAPRSSPPIIPAAITELALGQLHYLYRILSSLNAHVSCRQLARYSPSPPSRWRGRELLP